MTKYSTVRSNRKTLAIHITRDAAVEVRAPLRMPQAAIDSFVKSKEKWIEAHLAKQQQRNEEAANFKLCYGDTALLFGVRYPIAARRGNMGGFDKTGFFLPPGLTPIQIRDGLIQIYRAQARNLLVDMVNTYAGRMKVEPSGIRVTGAKTSWGSCSGANNLSFTWRLMMAPIEVVEYVVVHELAHIREHNHSQRFWAAVEGVLPDYRSRKDALKILQRELAAQDWDGSST